MISKSQSKKSSVKPLADYTAKELLEHLVKDYPNGCTEQLDDWFRNGDIGYYLYKQTLYVLEGRMYYAEAKTNSTKIGF